MYCTKCGADIPEGVKFCTKCGNPAVTPGSNDAVQSAQPGTYYNPPVEQPGAYYNPQAGQAGAYYSAPGSQAPYNVSSGGSPIQTVQAKKPKHLKAILISIAGVIVVAGGVILTLVLMFNANAARYNKALDLMNTDPSKAKTEFTALGNFVDSPDKAELCQNMADYSSAKDLMDAKNYKDAETSFEALGSYNDSAQMAGQCKNHIDYDKAAALKKAGSTAQALDIFKSLGSFLDSKDQATDCQNIINYAAAKALYDKRDFSGARDAFANLANYSDSNNMRDLCNYEIADEYYKEGKYFSAFKIFPMLNGVKDSAELAKNCVRNDFTKTGELFRDPNYKSGKVPLTFKAPDDKNVTYIKIYKDETLVSTVYIASGEKVKIKLPAGTYSFKTAYGSEWFGEKELFGDSGYYHQVVFNSNGDTTWTLRNHWIYTLTLRMSNGGYSGNNISPDNF